MKNLSINASKLIELMANVPTSKDTLRVPSVAVINTKGDFEVYDLNNIQRKIATAIGICLKINPAEDFKDFTKRCFNKESFSVCNTYNVLRKEDEIAIILNIPFDVRLLGCNQYADITFKEEVLRLIKKGKVS